MEPPRETIDAAIEVAGYYTYRPPQSELVIHLSLDALDTMLGDILAGFGAIPKRGAEVGGILLGRIEEQKLWIEDFATVACEHRRGPSYLLSDKDRETFTEVFERHRARERYPVGLFRSNTREQNGIGDEDRELFGRFFSVPTGTFLLVRPYAAKTSTATFLIYREGVLQESNDDLFPFQRWELEGGAPPPRRPLSELRARRLEALPEERPESVPPALDAVPVVPQERPPESSEQVVLEQPQEPAAPEQVYAYQRPPEPYQPRRRGWFWIPLSFIFLLIGILLGFQSAITLYPQPTGVEPAAYQLGLTAELREDSLRIRWNRESPGIKLAQRGRLEIRDGQFSKVVDLDSSSLQTGSVMYPPLSANVSLRFEVTIKGTSSVVERLDWSRSQ
jgi:hypothetical protein